MTTSLVAGEPHPEVVAEPGGDARLVLVLGFPTAAGAAVETVNFDGNDAVNVPVGSPLETAGLITFSRTLGFRPYRTDVGPARAKTGSFVGDAGRCIDEAIANGEPVGGCEQFQAQTTVVLGHTAETVSLFAGRFGPVPEEAKLTAYNVLGQEVGHMGPLPIGETFNRFLEVHDPAGTIAKFKVEALDGQSAGADLGIDEVSVNFSGSGDPDFFIATTSQVIPIVQGQTAEVPVSVVRLNGSSGRIELNVEGLPDGVSAFPAEVEPGKSSATIKLIADPSATDTHFEPKDVKIVARPFNSNVGPGPRSANFSLRVATDFRLTSGDISDGDTRKVLIEAPDCAPVNVPIAIDRDIAMNRSVELSLLNTESGAPPVGVGAEFLPSATVPPGGNLRAQRTLRLRAGPTSILGVHEIGLQLQGSDDPHVPPRQLEMAMLHVDQATVGSTIPGSDLGVIPRFLGEGSLVRVHGLGFCPGTQVEVGNELAKVPAKLLDDHTIEFRVPRYATTGRLTIDPPGNFPSYKTEDRLVVDNVRDTNAFPFRNYPFAYLGIDEFAKAFGEEEIFLHVNPCWPFGDCSVSTGFLSPLAAFDWGWMNGFLRSSGGHCFGINLAIQQLESGNEPRRRYADSGLSPNPRNAFEMSTPSGPGEVLNDFLDAMHARQYSDEFLRAWLNRDRSMQHQLGVLERELGRGREPMIALERSSGSGHAVLAYDMERTATGTRIYVYDNERPFTLNEEVAAGLHRAAVEQSTITTFDATYTWRFPVGGNAPDWTGSGANGSFWVVPLDAIPANPSLPDLSSQARSLISSLGIGSAGGSVRVRSATSGADFMPTSDLGAPEGNGVLVSDRPEQPLRAIVEGREHGSYTQVYTAPSFSAGVRDVATGRGVRDTVAGAGDSLSFEGGTDRVLRIELARRASEGMSEAATLETHASANGTDTAGFDAGGALFYAHKGDASTLRLTLTTVRRQGGPATFVSPQLSIHAGDRLRVVPLGRDLRRVRLEVRDSAGRRHTRVLRSRGGAPGRVKLGAVSASRRRIVARYSLAGLHQRALAGAVLRLVRGHHVLARHAIAKVTANGARTIVWRPRRHFPRGRYRLLVDLRVLSLGTRGSTVSGSVRAHRAAAIRVR